MKISKKISISLALLLVLGLSGVFGLVYINIKNVMEDTSISRFKESAQTRSQYLQSYIDDAELYLKAFAQSSDVINALYDNSNQNIASAQEYTERYAKTNANLENIYIADTQSVPIASMVKKAIGVQLRKDEALEALVQPLFSSEDVLNLGVLVSPSTGALVLSMYCPVYDAMGNPLGFTGMALRADELLLKLNELKFVGVNDCTYTLLDATKGIYISSADAEQNGQVITDENYLSLINAASENTENELYHTEYKDSITMEDKIAVFNYIQKRGWIFVIEAPKASVISIINKMVITLIAVCVVFCVVCVICIFFIINLQMKCVERVAAAIKDVAKLNISDNPHINRYLERKDEVGIIAKATHSLISELRNIIGSLKNNSQDLTAESENLNRLFQQSKDSVDHVELAVVEIATGAGNQSEETQKASNSVVQIGAMIEQLNDETIHVHNNANEMNAISSKMVSTLSELKSINQKTEQSVTEVHKQTDLTNESIMKIQNAVAIIASIADETSLLSLNASIEAARAGEEGRGFAVVATQIKKLAEQSNASTTEINQIISEVMKDSQTTVKIMQEVSENVRQQTNQMEETMAAFQQLSTEIMEAIDGINNISDQTKKIDESRIAVIDVVTNLSAIAQQNAASSQETTATVSIVNEKMMELVVMAEKLAQMADSIDAEIRGFVLES